jgi:hypothetical protein
MLEYSEIPAQPLKTSLRRVTDLLRSLNLDLLSFCFVSISGNYTGELETSSRLV